jgi:hypothetical protein
MQRFLVFITPELLFIFRGSATYDVLIKQIDSQDRVESLEESHLWMWFLMDYQNGFGRLEMFLHGEKEAKLGFKIGI